MLILDGTFYETPKFGHISIKQAIQILQKLKLGKAFFVHINHTEPLDKELDDLLMVYGYHPAYDGLRLKI